MSVCVCVLDLLLEEAKPRKATLFFTSEPSLPMLTLAWTPLSIKLARSCISGARELASQLEEATQSFNSQCGGRGHGGPCRGAVLV